MRSSSLAILTLAMISCSLSSCAQAATKWNALKVTWGINPFGPAFNDLPRTVRLAERQRWVKKAGCSDGAIGERYVLKGDESVVLIYNLAGEIAGVATHVPKENTQSANYPTGNQLRYFDLEGDNYVMNAYFTDPSLICQEGSSSSFNRLIIKSKTNSFEVAQESAGGVNGFTEGKCFWSMGKHYWAAFESQLSATTKFGDFFPGFLLYNNGDLTGFGFAGFGESKWMGTSSRYEHPDSSAISGFMQDVPDFFYESGFPQLATMHIYFTNNPRFNRC